MITMRLHGPLAVNYGGEWNLQASSVREAIHAIDMMVGGLCREILRLSNLGMVFKVSSTRVAEMDDNDVPCILLDGEHVDIIPVVQGSSAGVRFVIGATLVAISGVTSVATYGAATPVDAALFNTGVSLMLGSVIEWLTPVTKTMKQDQYAAGQSWSFGGPINTVDQGMPVPLAYGEVLAGSHAISAGISVSSLSPSGAVAPSAQIGGNLTGTYSVKASTERTVRIRLSGGCLALSDPYTYNWTLGSFSGGYNGLRLVDSTSGISTLEVDMVAGQGSTVTVTGTVNLSLTGRESNPANGADPANVIVSTSANVRITVIGV